MTGTLAARRNREGGISVVAMEHVPMIDYKHEPIITMSTVTMSASMLVDMPRCCCHLGNQPWP